MSWNRLQEITKKIKEIKIIIFNKFLIDNKIKFNKSNKKLPFIITINYEIIIIDNELKIII
jgi:hypothetical protein